MNGNGFQFPNMPNMAQNQPFSFNPNAQQPNMPPYNLMGNNPAAQGVPPNGSPYQQMGNMGMMPPNFAANNGMPPNFAANNGIPPNFAANNGLPPNFAANNGLPPNFAANNGLPPNFAANNGMPPNFAMPPNFVPPPMGYQQIPPIQFPSQKIFDVYSNKRWTFTQNIQFKTNYQQKKQDFKNMINQQNNQQECFKFKLSEQRTISIPKRFLVEYQEITAYQLSSLVDVSVIYQITNSYQGVEDALFYCYHPYIELDENLETTSFLLSCAVLDINSPWSHLLNYFKLIQNNPSQEGHQLHQLKNGDDIILIYLFQDACQKIGHLQSLSNYFSSQNQVEHPISQYLNLLLSRNPKYFFDQRNLSFNEKIRELEQNTFISIVLQNFIYQVVDNGRAQNQLVDIKQVDLVHKFLEFYFFQASSVENPNQVIDQEFTKFYQKYENQLSELDKIEALKYQKSDSSLFIQQLKSQYTKIQQYRIKELALIKLLIAQRAQNIALDALKDQYNNSLKLLLNGEDFYQDLQNQIDLEIKNIEQQQQFVLQQQQQQY